MPTVDIAIINESTVLDDQEVTTAIMALQTQIHNDFAPIWGVDANLRHVPQGSQPAHGEWWLVILDDSDQATALGYHDLTEQGLPLGKVFAKSDMTLGYQWTVTASHEVLEMLADPDIDMTIFLQKEETGGKLYAYEVCDPCEADEFGYKIHNTLVSDFILPAWFETFHKHDKAEFDFCKHITQPLEILRGGYIGVFDVAGGTGWHRVTAMGEHFRYDMRPRLGSRRERRRTLRDHWLLSRVNFQRERRPRQVTPAPATREGGEH